MSNMYQVCQLCFSPFIAQTMYYKCQREICRNSMELMVVNNSLGKVYVIPSLYTFQGVETPFEKIHMINGRIFTEFTLTMGF